MKKKKVRAIPGKNHIPDHEGKIKRKAVSLIASAVLLLLAVFAPAFASEGEDRVPQPADNTPTMNVSQGAEKNIIAAKVNGAEITLAAVNAMIKRMNTRKNFGDQQPESDETIRKDALDRLIFQELAYQKAKAEGLTADPKDVETALTNLKQKLGTDEEYQKFLRASDMTEKELREELERAIIVDRIFTKEVFGHTVITDDEVKKEYEKEKEKYVTPEKVIITDVVFFLDTKDKDSLKKAEAVLEKIKADEDKDPWKLVPDGTFAVREIEIKKDQEKALYEAAIKLQPDELSGVVTTHDSIHIFKLKDYAPSKQLTFEEIKGPLKAALRKQAQKERLSEWKAELTKNAKIEILDTGGSEK